MTSAMLTPDKIEPLLAKKSKKLVKKSRKIRRQRRIISSLLQDSMDKPKKRISKPPTEKQLAARQRMRQRMKLVSSKAQEIYRQAPPGSMKWIDAVRQAWKQM
jgi:hypothetical protein